MTATIEAPVPAAVVMTTADGESRAAKMWGQGSWSCGFCDTPVFSPADWEEHEQANAGYYGQRGETYEPEPYSYRAKYFDGRECPNPMCVSALTGAYLERYRQQEAAQRERDERREREEAYEQARCDAAEQATAAREAAMGELRGQAEQVGFAWACFREQASGYGTNVACAARGNDRAEYLGHMKDHGARAYHGTKRIKLRRKPPAAPLPKLEVSPFKWLTWTETHAEPGVCECGHDGDSHRMTGEGGNLCAGCGMCTRPAWNIEPAKQTAQRRGQFWAVGTYPHSVWVLPFDAAPWEDGRPAPVLVYPGKAGRAFTDAYSAKYDRR